MSSTMEPQNNTHFAKSLIIIIVVFIAGGTIGVVVDPYLPSAISNAKKGYDVGFAAARKVVEESNFGAMFRTPDDVRTLSGIVTTISDNQLTIHFSQMDPFSDPKLDDRTVLINDSTTIVTLVQRDTKLFQAEMSKFTEWIRLSSATSSKGVIEPMVLPTPFAKTVVDRTAIKVGDALTITAFENIKTAKEFIAKEIQIQSRTVSSSVR